MDEIEILRGAKVRVTTQTVTVDSDVTPINAIAEAVVVEADHRVRFLPAFFLILGAPAGIALHLVTGWVARPVGLALAIMIIGAVLWRDSWLHQVTARLANGERSTLYRTSKKGDALLFHAAVEKALELRANP